MYNNMQKFQSRVDAWMMKIFGIDIRNNKKERVHRFLEEAMELAQSLDYTKEEAQTMLDYVWNRPPGDPVQEVGGTMHCLAALCNTTGISIADASEQVIEYCEEHGERIAEKHRNKPDSIAIKNTTNGEEKNTMP